MRAIAALAAFTLAAFSGAAAEPVDIREWKAPYPDSRPRDPFAQSATSIWFVGQTGGYIAQLDAATGAFTKVDLPEGEGAHNLIVGSDGVVWYAGNRRGVIGRHDPATGETLEIAMPDPAARDPHTLVFDDGEKNIWFTVQGGNFIGRLNIATRKVDLIASPAERSRPYGVKVAPDGAVWADLFGVNKLARIDPATLAIETVDLPRADARPRRIEITADGRVWYGDYAGGMLGAYDPKTKTFSEWTMPSGAGSKPYGMASDATGRIWLVETGPQPNLFVGFDPQTEAFFSSAPVPSGGGTVRHMHYYEPAGTVWFGADTNFIGRAIVEPEKAR